ncbi:MAG: class I SAM-dependent methyltransferase [Alphaproteobacteria bacterium]|nr:class I SAM-dependent methyltransferase [Alphaproteobacteria bacterium]
MQNISSLLLYPFEKENLEWPEKQESVLIFGAGYIDVFSNIQNITPVSPFKMQAESWSRAGYDPQCEVEDRHAYDFALCHITQQKEAAKGQIATCLKALKKNGILVVIAANDAGGGRIQKWMDEIGLKTGSLSKNKCRIVWASQESVREDILKEWDSYNKNVEITIGEEKFYTRPGIYGWNKTDKGSELLIQNLPENLSGRAADFGCGYGYLSMQILKGADHDIQKLYAIDADNRALQAAQKNLKEYEVEYLWQDLRKAPENMKPLDFIIMNPPFHAGKQTDSDIGLDFIKSAYVALKNRGTLYMVANAHLPYEDVLKNTFKDVIKVVEKYSFKVFEAQK